PAFSTSTDGYDVDFIASTANASGASGSPEDGPGTVNPDVTPVGLVVNAFPNPTAGPLTIDFGYRETGYAPTEATTVSVLHATGRLVSRTVRQAGSTDQLSLDLSGQSDGIYFVAVQLGSGPVTYKKLILQH
ncbi:MAG: T9SS type A sorting domain-containing protein, partial [Ferruginibacter sp.]|nr:T9SS type A sorting domain-containing protein [Cytophagales bacterium]